MTDNEIIVALKYCINDDYANCKEKCPFYEKCIKQEKLGKYALILIERQQTEITRLTEAFENFSTDIDTRDVEDFELIRKVRTDTICELAKRLEKRLVDNYDISPIGYQSVIHDVSICTNEMIGELL